MQFFYFCCFCFTNIFWNIVMNNRIKKTHILFASLISVLLIAHAVFPHHHHYHSISSSLCHDQHDSHQDLNEPEETDYHCQAFNNIVDNNYKKNLSRLIIDHPLFTSVFTESYFLPDLTVTINFITFDDIRTGPFYHHIYSLRGPPSLL